MILNIALKLIQSHGYISIKAQLNLSNRIEIGETQPKKKRSTKIKNFFNFRTEISIKILSWTNTLLTYGSKK